MIADYIRKLIFDHFEYTPTANQTHAATVLSEFVSSEADNCTMLLKGFAGTGKTTLIASFIKMAKQSGLNVILMAPTGRAAKVLAGYSGGEAFTIHKRIYRQSSGGAFASSFELGYNKESDTIFIVDEASMIGGQSSDSSPFGTGNLLDDLLEFVFSGNRCKLILVGDEAQLPPIGTLLSPALNPEELKSRNLTVFESMLSEVVRQSESSGILMNATQLRKQYTDNQLQLFPKVRTKGFTDVVKLGGAEFTEALEQSYATVGEANALVITRSNKRANLYNQGIRASILYRDSEISGGDRLLIVRNNYFWSRDYNEVSLIANGDIAEIQRIGKFQELYGFRFVDVSLLFPELNGIELDAKIWLDGLFIDDAAPNYQMMTKLANAILEDYPRATTRPEKSKILRNDPYYNALQVKFAWAVTCHKAQGGQWPHVFIDQGYITEEMVSGDYLRWIYTAFTRATQKVYTVNFPDEQFVD